MLNKYVEWSAIMALRHSIFSLLEECVIDDHVIEIIVQLEPVRLGSGLPMMKIKTSLKGKITTLVMLKQLNGVLNIERKK